MSTLCEVRIFLASMFNNNNKPKIHAWHKSRKKKKRKKLLRATKEIWQIGNGHSFPLGKPQFSIIICHCFSVKPTCCSSTSPVYDVFFLVVLYSFSQPLWDLVSPAYFNGGWASVCICFYFSLLFSGLRPRE